MLKHNTVAILLVASLPLTTHAVDSYTADPAHTYALFSVSHFGYPTMHGRFVTSSGKITLDRAAKNGTVDITIAAASVSTGFAKRDEHWKSPDFFNVVEFPTIIYKSNSIKFNGDTPVSVEGKLTMLGVTKPVTLAIDAFKCGPNPMNQKEECGATASAQIKRSDFGMKTFLPGTSDDIKLKLEIEAYKD